MPFSRCYTLPWLVLLLQLCLVQGGQLRTCLLPDFGASDPAVSSAPVNGTDAPAAAPVGHDVQVQAPLAAVLPTRAGLRLVPLSGSVSLDVGLHTGQFGPAASVGGGGGVYPGGGATPAVGQGCSYWCRDYLGRFYCCQTPTGTHPGRCPPRRPFCPPSAAGFAAPQPCAADLHCVTAHKCCYDVCLQQHVCKPAE